MKRQVGTHDLTPTWVAVAPVIALGLTDGTETGKRLAKEELLHMARVADLLNELAPAAEVLLRDADAMGAWYGAIPRREAVALVLDKITALREAAK